ncbi:helix-turn-helix transcriptional regulator [Streptomyces sp. NPDC050610]|uniref:helix-turn-helix domain-containing protein n=1 Tax=Streptomyces sp. NPDC050610 TaxID=3157097 RepID=UPI00341F981C
MPLNPNPTIRQRRLAQRLRELRQAAKMTHADVAKALGSAESKVGRIENAQSGVRLPDLRALLDAYGVDDPSERAAIEALAKEARQRGWWSRYRNAIGATYAAYVAVEWDAAEIYAVESNLVPGLLQTPAYAEAVMRLQTPDLSDETIAAQVEVRQERRKVLARATPVRLWVVMAEAALLHHIGESHVMKEQVEFLIRASHETNIELQILPQSDPMNACLFGSFVIMSFPGATETDVVYNDLPTSTVYYEETDEVEKYTQVFRRLNMAASSVEQSRALLENVLREMV